MKFLEAYSKVVNAYLGQSQRPLHILAFMSLLECAEAGNEVKRISTKDGGVLTEDRRDLIVEEMGDEFYYFTARMNHLGVTLEDIIQINLQKLEDKHGRNGRLDSIRDVIYAGYSPVPDMQRTN